MLRMLAASSLRSALCILRCFQAWARVYRSLRAAVIQSMQRQRLAEEVVSLILSMLSASRKRARLREWREVVRQLRRGNVKEQKARACQIWTSQARQTACVDAPILETMPESYSLKTNERPDPYALLSPAGCGLSLPSRLLSAEADSFNPRDVNVAVLHDSLKHYVGSVLRVPRNALVAPTLRANRRPAERSNVTVEQRAAAARILSKTCVHMELAIYQQRYPRAGN